MATVVQEKPQVKPAIERIVEQIAEQSGQALDPERLRVKIGQRIPYGELASGKRRDQLTEPETDAILSAIKEPVKLPPGVSAEDYEGSRPGIEISVGDPSNGYESLFREERDGVISVNSLQLEQQSQAEATIPELQTEVAGHEAYSLDGDRLVEAPVAADTSEVYLGQDRTAETSVMVEPTPAVTIEPEPSDELSGDTLVAAAVQTEAFPNLLKEIVNPLNRETSEPIEAGLGAYTIKLDGANATVSKGEEVLLEATGGQVTQSSLSEKDTQALQTLLQRSSVSAESWTVPVQTPEPELMAKEPHPAIAVAQKQIEALPESRAKQFFQKLGADLGAQATRAVQSVRQGLESEQFKALQQKAVGAVQSAPEKSAETIGRGLEQTGRWVATRPEAIQNAATAMREASAQSAEKVGGALEKAGQWLSSRPETIREQRAAKTALALFAKGHNRTQESSYEHGGMKVAVTGADELSLSDAKTGDTLMRFKVESSSEPGQAKLTVTEKNISSEQYRALDAISKAGEPVRGSPEAEMQHAQKSEQFAQFSKAVASAMGSSDCKTQHYRIEVGDDSLKISDSKSGREVYRQEGSQIESRLEQKDFGRVAQALNSLAQPVTQTPVSQPNQAEIG